MSSRPLLLIIDDVPENVEVLGETLSDIGDISFALSGPQGLALIEEALPDLILLDVMMPGMDGYEVIDVLKRQSHTQSVPVIFVTAKNDAQSETRALAAGAVDFIHKPINQDVVRARVGLHLRLQQQRQQMEQLNQQLAQSLDQVRRSANELVRARDRELRISAAIQQQLLFGKPPAGLQGFAIACYTEASQGVDGDFYTFTQIGPSIFDLLTGDVMGKGVKAALIGAGVTTLYRKSFAELMARQSTLPSPATLINAIHADITPRLMADNSFVTLALLRFDQQAQTVTWVNAGHTPTLLAAQGAAVTELLGDNMPIGVLQSELYQEHVSRFGSGDSLLIYSDGFSESLNAEKVEYGTDAMKRILTIGQHGGALPTDILDALRNDLHQFTQGAKGADDRTAVIVQACVPDAVPGP